MAVYVRPFKASDLKAFVPLEPLGEDKLAEPKMAKAIEDSGLAVTGIRDGEIVGCGGVHPTKNEEQGEIWFRLSKDCLNHRIDTLRWLKCGLKIIEETYPFKQLNAVILCSYKKGIKLAEHFGFKSVQTKDDYIIYAKLVRD